MHRPAAALYHISSRSFIYTASNDRAEGYTGLRNYVRIDGSIQLPSSRLFVHDEINYTVFQQLRAICLFIQ